MGRDNSHCPRACSPAGLVPESTLASVLEQAQNSHRTMLGLMLSAAVPSDSLPRRAWRSPGEKASDPARRTFLDLVDNADRLLELGKAKRTAVLERM